MGTYTTAVCFVPKNVSFVVCALCTRLQAGIQIGRAEMLDDTMVTVLNKVNGTKHAEATTVLFEIAVSDKRVYGCIYMMLSRVCVR